MSAQKNCPRYFWIPKYAFLNILKKNISKKVVPGILEIRKYDFLNISKPWQQTIFPRYFQVCKYAFLNISKRV